MLAYLRLDAHLYEWRFNLRTGQTRERSLDDENTEFPTVNNYALGCHSRFAYNVHINSERTLLFDGLTRYDLQQKRSDTYWFGEGRFGSEAPLTPRPNAKSEDDGYIVSFVHDERENQSEVVILDAANVQAGPIGRVLIPQRVPLGFHACWVAEAQLPENVASSQ
jgi:carotenoid cleavage dioxygenase